MSTIRRWAVITGVIAVTAVALPAAAYADDSPSGRDFGQHESTCAQTTGLDGMQNPGMHQGFANWNGMECE